MVDQPGRLLNKGSGMMNLMALPGTDAFVSAKELANPPSCTETAASDKPIDMESENSLRIFGCELIQAGCILLKLPQVAALSGQMLFHRFYYKVSFTRFDVENTSMAALFLAAKREECSPFRKVKDYINVWDNMRKRRLGKAGKELAPLSPWSEDFKEQKERMISAERMMLKKLGFVLFVEHPHKFIIMYLQQLELWDLKQSAWNYCNDSFRTTLCCRYPAEVIACGALLLACRKGGVRLPAAPCIWAFFSTSKADVESVAKEIEALYRREKAALIEVYIRRPSRRELKEKAAKEAAAKKKIEDAAKAVKAAEEEKIRKEAEEKERKERGTTAEDDKKKRSGKGEGSDDGSDSGSDASGKDGRGRDSDRRGRDRRQNSRSPRRRSRSRSRSRGRRDGGRRSFSRERMQRTGSMRDDKNRDRKDSGRDSRGSGRRGDRRGDRRDDDRNGDRGRRDDRDRRR